MSPDDPSFQWGEAEEDLLSGIVTSVPVSARIWNYWMGGKDYYRADQEAGDQFVELYPGIRDMARGAAWPSSGSRRAPARMGEGDRGDWPATSGNARACRA